MICRIFAFYIELKKRLMRVLLVIILAVILVSCRPQKTELKTGLWRGVIEMQGHQLPFGFEVQKTNDQYRITVMNAEERLKLDEVIITSDSVRIVMHIFDTELRAKIEDGRLTGYFIKNYDPINKLPFYATHGDDFRFAKDAETELDFSGKYSLEFQSATEKYVAVGIFKQSYSKVTGTFLTPAGDYRYLQGDVIDNELFLSAFDGNHAYVFTAHFEGDSIKGNFYSGKTSLESWKGIRNEKASLPDLESLTFLKEGYEKLEFSFPDVNGNKISNNDECFKNKVVILQLFGTWCPNCMDETKFLTKWYEENKDRGIEILGLAYERKDDFEYASSRVKKMKEKLGVGYDFVIAGTYDKAKASETLPALNRVIAFPTTIFIGRDGKVKHIHTGFSGPGTGIYYDQFKERFNQIVNELLTDKLPLSN
jgi:thiol-disulfide isomerase/thioredoxin